MLFHPLLVRAIVCVVSIYSFFIVRCRPLLTYGGFIWSYTKLVFIRIVGEKPELAIIRKNTIRQLCTVPLWIKDPIKPAFDMLVESIPFTTSDGNRTMLKRFHFPLYKNDKNNKNDANKGHTEKTGNAGNIGTTAAMCKYRFLSCSLSIIGHDDTFDTFELMLSSEHQTFYVEGNELNRVSLCYLVNAMFGKSIDHTTVQYTLTLMDDNIDVTQWKECDSVVLGLHTYGKH